MGISCVTDDELTETAARLQETLEDFTIMAEVVGWVAGPTVTLFKVDLPAGVRVSRVMALNDDIALALAAPVSASSRPFRNQLRRHRGAEQDEADRLAFRRSRGRRRAFANRHRQRRRRPQHRRRFGENAPSPHRRHDRIGQVGFDQRDDHVHPHARDAFRGALHHDRPETRGVHAYNGIPHLYVPVVTEAREAASALSWGVAEMERRLKVFSKVGARNIGQFNAKVQQAKAEAEAAQERGEEVEPWKYDDELPYIVIVIDELADLMMNVGKEVEFSISRIAQLARAAGIHLIVATQRPSANVVTGLIKANITNRIAFNVASSIDSRVVLDSPGAENLIGLGDLLFSKPEYPQTAAYSRLLCVRGRDQRGRRPSEGAGEPSTTRDPLHERHHARGFFSRRCGRVDFGRSAAVGSRRHRRVLGPRLHFQYSTPFESRSSARRSYNGSIGGKRRCRPEHGA